MRFYRKGQVFMSLAMSRQSDRVRKRYSRVQEYMLCCVIRKPICGIIQLMHSSEANIRICQPEKGMSTEAKRKGIQLNSIQFKFIQSNAGHRPIIEKTFT